MSWPKNKWISPLLLIVIPLSGIILYIYAFAENRYTSESQVVVKQISDDNNSNVGGLGVLLGNVSTSIEDTRYLQSYIESPDMLMRLDQRLNLRVNFQGNGKDPVFQLSKDASKEDFLKFYKRVVSVELVEQSGILQIGTQGFDPEFTLHFNDALLQESENFINEISRKTAVEQLRFSEQQLAAMSARLSQSRQNLLNYQNENKTIDPAVSTEAINKLVSTLQSTLAELQTQERTFLSYLNPDTPQVISVHSQIAALQEQIENEKSKLTSLNGKKLNAQALAFEKLKSDVDFSTDLYRIALSSLEKSRIDATRKLKSLVIISSPQRAQESAYPRRLYLIMASIMLLLLMYGLIGLISAVISDHKD